MEDDWKRDITQKPKLGKCVTLRENFAISDYVSILLPKPHSNIFAHLAKSILHTYLIGTVYTFAITSYRRLGAKGSYLPL